MDPEIPILPPQVDHVWADLDDLVTVIWSHVDAFGIPGPLARDQDDHSEVN